MTTARKSKPATAPSPSKREGNTYALPPGTGRVGETVAARRLTELGYKILRRNHRTRYGEIDIVATQGGEIVFLEVKTRRRRWPSTNMQFMDCAPVDSMTRKKALRVSQCAEAFMAHAGIGAQARWRLDFVGVELDTHGRALDVEVIRNIEID